MNESVRSNSYMMSPNRAGNYGGFSTTSQKLDSLRKTPTAEYSQDYLNPSNMNTSMSFLTLNNSAEKQLNYSRANVSFRQSINVDNLINICSKKLEIEPTHRKALFIRASSYMKKGQYQEAIGDCNTLLEIDQRNVGAYYTRGCAYEKLGEIDKGIADFTVVLELDPNHVNAAFARGACQNRKVISQDFFL